MTELLTREEHKARAMLLGMVVNVSGGYYFKSGKPFIRVDMFTLEPIDVKEADRRNLLVAKTGKYYYD
jgi:hypothetical protein